MIKIHLFLLVEACSNIKEYIENNFAESDPQQALKKIVQELDGYINELYSLQVISVQNTVGDKIVLKPYNQTRYKESIKKTAILLESLYELITKLNNPDLKYLTQAEILKFNAFIKDIPQKYDINFDTLDISEAYQIDCLIYPGEKFPSGPEPFKFNHDPLSDEQKNKIISYFYSFIYPLRKNIQPLIKFRNRELRGEAILNLLRGIAGESFNTLSELEQKELVQECNKLPFSPVSMGVHTSFEEFFAVFYQPEIKAGEFGIDVNNHKQMYAVKLLVKSAIFAGIQVKNEETEYDRYNRTTNPYEIISKFYRDEFCHKDKSGNYILKGRHQLLLDNDPIQNQPLISPSPLELLLTHTYFQTGRWMTKTTYHPVTNQKIEQRFYQDREEHRQILKKELSRLYEDPSTNLVMTALGIALNAAKANIYFSMSNLHCGSLGSEYNMGLETSGFYDKETNSLVCCSLIDNLNNQISKEHIGTLVHEGLHFLFNHLYENKSSPVRTGSQEEKALDMAIEADQNHRKTLDTRNFISDEQSVWCTVVDFLEKNEHYNLDNSSANRLRKDFPKHTMRTEIIVRPMEQIAMGVSEDAVNKIMPNVYRFYKEKCVPVLQQYIKTSLFNDSNSHTTTKTVELSTQIQPVHIEENLAANSIKETQNVNAKEIFLKPDITVINDSNAQTRIEPYPANSIENFILPVKKPNTSCASISLMVLSGFMSIAAATIVVALAFTLFQTKALMIGFSLTGCYMARFFWNRNQERSLNAPAMHESHSSLV